MELISKKTCTVKGCNAQREEGDLLFCLECRKKWKDVCRKEGILEVQVDWDELNKFLKAYQEEGTGWVN